MIKSDFLRRLRALTIKEWCQLVRDPSSFAVGLVLPLVLIFIFGSGLSLDLGNTPIAVINQAPGNVSYAIEQGFKGSPYLTPINCGNIKEAEGLMRKKTVKGIVVIPSNFAGQFQVGKGKLQLIVHGVDTVSASSLERYIQQSVQISLGKLGYSSDKGAVPVVRLWFNAANSSTWYFVPGLVVVVITIVGAFLTALVIAREWGCCFRRRLSLPRFCSLRSFHISLSVWAACSFVFLRHDSFLRYRSRAHWLSLSDLRAFIF